MVKCGKCVWAVFGWRRKVGSKVGPFESSKLIRVGRARRVKRARRAKLSPGGPVLACKGNLRQVHLLPGQFKDVKVASTIDTNNYQWGYESIYEEDVISAAAAQLVAWKERLDMNAQLRNEEDALSAAAVQLAAWKERLEMNVVISPTCNTCGAAHLIEECPFIVDNVQYMEQYNYSQQEDMYSNTYNPDRWDYPNFLGYNDQNIQCPTNLPDFPQPMQQSENKSSLDELMTQYPNLMMPTPPSLFKQPSFNLSEEKASQ
ncbi:hypothetical protein ACLOJK_027521, partial [Asimina triloba]